MQYTASDFINTYMNYLLLPLSLLCNIFTIITTIINNAKKTTYTVYIICLSLVDFSFTLSSFVLSNPYLIHRHNDISCFVIYKFITSISICSVLFLYDSGINRDARKCWKMGPKGSFDVATGAAVRKRRLWQSRAGCTHYCSVYIKHKEIQLQTQTWGNSTNSGKQ